MEAAFLFVLKQKPFKLTQISYVIMMTLTHIKDKIYLADVLRSSKKQFCKTVDGIVKMLRFFYLFECIVTNHIQNFNTKSITKFMELAVGNRQIIIFWTQPNKFNHWFGLRSSCYWHCICWVWRKHLVVDLAN